MDRYQELREEMVRTQIESRGIKNRAVLRALRIVERHLFVPDDQRQSAYADHPLDIGGGQTISQPYIVAYMTELLDAGPQTTVLEIGTGSGYQTAVLGECAKTVYSVEVVKSLHERSSRLIERLGYKNVYTFLGNGRSGLPAYAPFDRIIITAAAREIPKPLIEQLAEGGVIVAPVGPQSGVQQMVRGVRTGGTVSFEATIPVRFVPLTGT